MPNKHTTTTLKAVLKKDGSKDQRYSMPQFVKKDGTRDKRTTLSSKK